jgi:hypothetical protein
VARCHHPSTPTTAILTVSSVRDVPVVKNGQVTPVGVEAVKFLQEVRKNLEELLMRPLV